MTKYHLQRFSSRKLNEGVQSKFEGMILQLNDGKDKLLHRNLFLQAQVSYEKYEPFNSQSYNDQYLQEQQLIRNRYLLSSPDIFRYVIFFALNDLDFNLFS